MLGTTYYMRTPSPYSVCCWWCNLEVFLHRTTKYMIRFCSFFYLIHLMTARMSFIFKYTEKNRMQFSYFFRWLACFTFFLALLTKEIIILDVLCNKKYNQSHKWPCFCNYTFSGASYIRILHFTKIFYCLFFFYLCSLFYLCYL